MPQIIFQSNFGNPLSISPFTSDSKIVLFYNTPTAFDNSFTNAVIVISNIINSTDVGIFSNQITIHNDLLVVNEGSSFTAPFNIVSTHAVRLEIQDSLNNADESVRLRIGVGSVLTNYAQ